MTVPGSDPGQERDPFAPPRPGDPPPPQRYSSRQRSRGMEIFLKVLAAPVIWASSDSPPWRHSSSTPSRPTGTTNEGLPATHVRLILLVARPQLVTLLVGFGLLGVVLGGGQLAAGPIAAVVVVVLGFVVAAVAVNDVADVAIDRINLVDDRAGRSSALRR